MYHQRHTREGRLAYHTPLIPPWNKSIITCIKISNYIDKKLKSPRSVLIFMLIFPLFVEFIPGVCDVHQTQGGWNYRPVEGSCNQYLTCDEQNKAFLMTCSHGTFYNTRKCRQAEEVDCPYGRSRDQ